MTDPSFRLQLLRTGHIMQQRRKRHRKNRFKIRFLQLPAREKECIPKDPFRMIEIMAAGSIAQFGAHPFLDPPQ